MNNLKILAWAFALTIMVAPITAFVVVAYGGGSPTTYRDPGTGCEYLVSPNGTLVPRFNDRRQAGCDK